MESLDKDVGQVAGSSLDRSAAGQDKEEVWQAGVATWIRETFMFFR